MKADLLVRLVLVAGLAVVAVSALAPDLRPTRWFEDEPEWSSAQNEHVDAPCCAEPPDRYQESEDCCEPPHEERPDMGPPTSAEPPMEGPLDGNAPPEDVVQRPVFTPNEEVFQRAPTVKIPTH